MKQHLSNNEYDELIAAVTFSEPETYETQKQKKAIIVAGGGDYPGNILWKATQKCTNFAYLALLTQGYTRENIYFLSSDTNFDIDGNGSFDDIDADATIENLSYAITTWAKDSSELILYMTDHGGKGTFMLSGISNPPEILKAEVLDGWLDSLQNIMTGKVIFIYDACYSGSFLSLLTPSLGKEEDRILITGSLTDERAWFEQNGILSFSYQFWAAVFLNAKLYDSFTAGQLMMKNSQSPRLMLTETESETKKTIKAWQDRSSSAGDGWQVRHPCHRNRIRRTDPRNRSDLGNASGRRYHSPE
ncbi:C13 family peptidase [Desulfococcaceae bacterium HSG8]|nr:C13 family peptidase [Desulfococcaceae bacterium HSG8]